LTGTASVAPDAHAPGVAGSYGLLYIPGANGLGLGLTGEFASVPISEGPGGDLAGGGARLNVLYGLYGPSRNTRLYVTAGVGAYDPGPNPERRNDFEYEDAWMLRGEGALGLYHPFGGDVNRKGSAEWGVLAEVGYARARFAPVEVDQGEFLVRMGLRFSMDDFD
jgi:hypothetical protein